MLDGFKSTGYDTQSRFAYTNHFTKINAFKMDNYSKHKFFIELLFNRIGLIILILLTMFNIKDAYDITYPYYKIYLPKNLIIQYVYNSEKIKILSNIDECPKYFNLDKTGHDQSWRVSKYIDVFAKQTILCTSNEEEKNPYLLHLKLWGVTTEQADGVWQAYASDKDLAYLAEDKNNLIFKPKHILYFLDIFKDNLWFKFSKFSLNSWKDLWFIRGTPPLFLDWLLILLAIRLTYKLISSTASKVYK